MYLPRLIALLIKLVRLPNLVVVAATMVLVAYHIVHPALVANGIAPVLHWTKFVEICLIILIVTASGYVINDLQDQEIDKINRPGTNPVAELGPDLVYWFYGFIVLAGFLVSTLLAFRLNERHLLWVYPVHTSILAIYSVYFKKKPLLGNLLVALYCAGVPAVILIAERHSLRKLSAAAPDVYGETLSICFLFMAFAFLATLLRELVKDLQDYEGDAALGRKTIPVMWGTSFSRGLAIGLAILVAIAILLPVLFAWPAFLQPALIGAICVLVVALLTITIQVFRARHPSDYGRVSMELKLLLLAGLLMLIFF